jgi:uncharacterized repeat protein (TIGR01451 family)
VGFSNSSLAANANCTISVNVTGTSSGAKNNSVSINSTAGGNQTTPGTASVTVLAPPSISKSFGAPTIPLNGNTTLSFTITNPNAGNSIDVSFTDTLPAGLVVASTPSVSNACNGSVTATPAATSVSYSNNALAAGLCTISVSVTGTTAGLKSNSVTINSTAGGNQTTPGTASVTVLGPPTISKSFSPTTIPQNGTATLTFQITNPNSSAIDASFTDTLTGGLQVASSPNVSNGCGGSVTATPAATSVSYSNNALAAGGPCTISVSVQGTSAGSVNNSVTIDSTAGGNGSTPGTASLTVLGPPTITKSFANSPIPLNGTTTLTFQITNPNGTTIDATFTDTLPSGLVVAGTPAVSNNCGGSVTATPAATSVSFSNSTLTEGVCTISVNVQGTTAGTKNNSVTIDSTAGGNQSTPGTASLTVLGPPLGTQVQVTETGFGVNRVTKLWTATMTVTNTSGAAISGPIEVVLTNLGGSGVTMSNNTGLLDGIPFITVPEETLAPGASVQVPIQFLNPNNVFVTFTPVTYSGVI